MADSFPFVMTVATLWLLIGVGLSLVMGRRGHNRMGWLILGTVMGPLAFILAVDSSRHDEVLEPIMVRSTGEVPAGEVDVLVGFDGSRESVAAVRAVRTLLKERIGHLTLATVVPYDGANDAERRARAALESLAGAGGPAGGAGLDLMVLHGSPAAALRACAAEGGYELIAVGTRGSGLSKRVLGSAAEELARGGTVPVLVVGDR